jgi:hypothetical protein
MSYSLLRYQLAASAHRLISADQAHFENMNDINQEFAKALHPAFSRYGMFGASWFITLCTDKSY